MKDFKLVTDSSCEIDPELKAYFQAEAVPFSMLLDSVNYIDDKYLDISRWLAVMKQSKHVPKSACPSPEAYADRFRKSMHVFATTISSHLSGSYNSAMIAKELVERENPDRKIHVFDSLSASAGEIAICLKLRECIEAHMDFDAIVERVGSFRDEMKTFFILENLDTLIKNGRMSKIVGYVASAMSLRPIMQAEGGEIKLFEKARGSVRAFTRLIEIIGEHCQNPQERSLVITHCNNERQANFLRAEAQKQFDFKQIYVANAAGLTSMYANDGGVIVAF